MIDPGDFVKNLYIFKVPFGGGPGTFLPLAGGTMAGAIVLPGNPTLPLQAATKQYVDAVAGGGQIKYARASFVNPPPDVTYNNGASGVGATITDNSGTFAPLVVDGLAIGVNGRFLLSNMIFADEETNGIYALTIQGDNVSQPWVATRTTDFDEASDMVAGTMIAIQGGNTRESEIKVVVLPAPVTIGTDPVLMLSMYDLVTINFTIPGNRLLGNSTSALGAASPITLGAGLAFVTGLLTNTAMSGGGGFTNSFLTMGG